MRRTPASNALALAMLAGVCAAASHAQITGPSTAQPPYMVPTDPASGVAFISVASNGNGTLTPNELYTRLNTGANNYRVVGLVDGQGALRTPQDIIDGAFTLLVNHEAGSGSGIVRDHGSRGSFVSLWRVRSAPGAANHLSVIGGQDLTQTVRLWNVNTAAFTTWNAATPMLLYSNNVYGGANPGNNGFGRFCSADLAPPGTYRFGNLGTDADIFLNGEEIGAPGRAFAHIVTGPEAGTTYELPYHADYSWENNITSPFPQAKTVCVGFDDATPGNVVVFVGQKQPTGNEVEKAGLHPGVVYAVGMNNTTVNGSGQRIEDRTFILGNSVTGPVESKRFFMINMGDLSNTTGAAFQASADAQGQMNFQRPEDGHWDPNNPRRLVFVTTDTFSGNSRLWEMIFDNIEQPELGGVITMLADGSVPASMAGGVVSATGITDVRMMDNICFTREGDVLIQEDVGNNPRLGRMWLYDASADRMIDVGISNSTYFTSGAPIFLTQDEETSGVVDAWDIVGPGWFLLNMQAHFGISGELVEGGQIIAAFIPQSLPTGCPGDANYNGAVAFDDLNLILTNFGKSGPGIAGDLNFDRVVDFADLNAALSNFGNTCN